ncbi:MAG: hypothetical protein ACRDF4_05035, partial [Rhabdochlamydiaceae bacterium]
NQDKRRKSDSGKDQQTPKGGRKVDDNQGTVMYDPVVAWLRRIIGQSTDREKALRPYRGINKTIDLKIDQLLKEL